MPLRSTFRLLLKTKAICVSIFLITTHCFAEIHPSNGSVLNYTQVMFEYDPAPGANNYKIIVQSNDDTQPFLLTLKNESLACIASGLQFGRSYKWHYEAYRKNKLIFTSENYSFSIGNHHLIDTNFYKANISVARKNAFSNDIIFLDYLGIAIDRTGRPVWFYPAITTDGRAEPNYRNIRMTNNGTITFQDNDNCYEIDLTGKILWKAPNDGRISGDKREFYHHDFRKLNDGTYLTTSYQYVEQPNIFKPSVTSRVRYNTLIQYDGSGRILWSWNEKDHVKKEILFQGHDSNATEVEGTHLNGFDYDEANNAIVMSFRNNSGIMKIDKQTGNIIYDLSAYGAQSGMKDPWFARQHGPMVLPGHRLLIYNNNAPDTLQGISYPKVLIVEEPLNGAAPKILWEYECRSDRFPKGIAGKEGYAYPLQNGNILVCMGTANFAFEVTPKKEIVWQADFEKFDQTKNSWAGFNNYRCTATSSLYPRYFTALPVKNNLIQINNEGTEQDSYRLYVLVNDGRTEIFSDSTELKPRSSGKIKIPFDFSPAIKQINVVITSVSRPGFSKMLVIKNPNQKN